MISPFDDAFIATLRKNIGAVFDMIRKLSAHQSVQDAQLKDLHERVKRLELTLYGLSEEFKQGESTRGGNNG